MFIMPEKYDLFYLMCLRFILYFCNVYIYIYIYIWYNYKKLLWRTLS